MRMFLVGLLIFNLFLSQTTTAQPLSDIIKQVKPGIVAIGIFNPTASPRVKLVGTGFVVAPGNRIVTNYHVVAAALDSNRQEQYVVLSGQGSQVVQHTIQKQDTAMAYDLTILHIEKSLPPLTLHRSNNLVDEGTDVAITGFPITQVLGLYPATHRGIIAANTPVAIPADSSANLHAAAVRRLAAPYLVYQLDLTAYPGNSGSPLYLAASGEVIGIINQVHVKSTREAVLSEPSGITYAIPVQHLINLLEQPN
jgi:serine protease Do